MQHNDKLTEVSGKSVLFPVMEVPAIGIPKNSDKEIDSTGYKFIVKKSSHEILGCVTDNYKVITNKQIMDKANPILKNKGAILKDVRAFGNGARTKWTFRFPDTKVEIAKGDHVNPEIVINNSYDGTSEVSAMGGAFRMLCLNGLTIGYALSKQGSRHVVWNKSNEIEKLINGVIDKTHKVFDNDFPMLIEKGVKEKHVGKLIEMFPGYTMESMVQYMLTHKPKNYWDLLNAATWTATHVMKRNSEATHKLENKIFDTVKRFAAQA